MKDLLIQSVAILLLVGLFGCSPQSENNGESENSFDTKKEQVIEAGLKTVARSMKSTLPRQVGGMTTMIDVEASGLTLTYYYEIDDPPMGKINEDEFHEQITSQLTHGLCTDKTVMKNLRNGVTYAYYYQDKDGSVIDELAFTLEDCEEAGDEM